MDQQKATKQLELDQLRLGESKAIRALYEDSFPSCSRLVLKNSGTMEDAQDVFQEAILVFIKKLKNPDFKLTSSSSTFMYAVVRNLWLKQLRKKGKRALLIIDDEEKHLQLPDLSDLEEVEKREEQHLAVEAAMRTLSKECQSIILHYYFNKLSLGHIAELLDYSQNFIKVKKKRCMDALKAKVFVQEHKS